MRALLLTVSASVLCVGCQQASDTKAIEAVKEIAPVVVKPSEATYEQPNIIILLADDLGFADLGFRGSDIETPNIDRLAREGLTLNRFYSMPICTPTRSALMTARDPMKLGSIYAGFQPLF